MGTSFLLRHTTCSWTDILPRTIVTLQRSQQVRKVSAKTHLISTAFCAGLSLCCTASKGAKSAALLLDGSQQIAEGANGKPQLTARSTTRNRITSVSIRGGWKYGIVLRSAHESDVEHINLVGVGPGHGSQVRAFANLIYHGMRMGYMAVKGCSYAAAAST